MVRPGLLLGRAALAASLSGCGAGGPTTSADCNAQVRLDGVVYTQQGSTPHAATRLGKAEEAECHDVGEDAPGSVFPDDPREVAVWTFADHPATEVVGVRRDGTTYTFFVVDSVSDEDRERIGRALSRPSRVAERAP